jgi:cyclopropane fatty-acyl-phospholipid synthase-like methyltransferase
MSNSSKFKGEYEGSFYDEDYFENGKASGKGWLENYRWMPHRSHKEAGGFINCLGLDKDSYVLDFGCAKGFLVRAFNELAIRADGCDISDYALSFASDNCWNCSTEKAWKDHYDCGYTHIVSKDVFEHLTPDQLDNLLQKFLKVADVLMCAVPIGDSGKYRIAEYHQEISHIIIEDEDWWSRRFLKNGWKIIKDYEHVPGIKDNWQSFANGKGNHVFVLVQSKQPPLEESQ